jgi:cell division protein FtsL
MFRHLFVILARHIAREIVAETHRIEHEENKDKEEQEWRGLQKWIQSAKSI